MLNPIDGCARSRKEAKKWNKVPNRNRGVCVVNTYSNWSPDIDKYPVWRGYSAYMLRYSPLHIAHSTTVQLTL